MAGMIVVLSMLVVIRAGATEIPVPGLPSATAAGASIEVGFTNGLLSVTARNAEVRVVLDTIATKSGVEIVLDKTIGGKVTVEFRDVKFEEGLNKVLKDVVEGGFSSEYVKKNDEKVQFALSKVTIARVGKEKVENKDSLRIMDITVQYAEGKEIAFAKWGDGKNEIPLMTEEIDGHVFRKGFARLRVGDDGTIYFVNWAHHKIYVYDKDGQPKKPIEISLMGHGFDVDHEGNVYVFLDNMFGPSDDGLVYVYGADGKLRDKVTIPKKEAVFATTAVIDDGILRDMEYNWQVYDFRRYLARPESHADRKRYLPGMRDSARHADDSNPELGIYLQLEWARNFEPSVKEGKAESGWRPNFEWEDSRGLPKNNLDLKYPIDWRYGDDPPDALGFDGSGRLYVLGSIETGMGRRFYNYYYIVVVDLEKKTAAYHRLKEVDDFVYESGSLRNNFFRFDVDNAGNVYHLFTTKEGVHIYKYALGGEK